MHTILIHLHEPPNDWHLIEPLFYRAQASQKLSIISCFEQKSGRFPDLFQEIVHQLYQLRITNWHAVFLMNTEYIGNKSKRLVTQIKQLKEELLNLLDEHDFSPVSTTFLLIDPLKRNVNFMPENENYLPSWKLDNYGYFFDVFDQPFNSSQFFQNDLQELDHIWTKNPLSLRDAGRMDHPSEEFLRKLEDIKVDVLDQINNTIVYKKKYLEENKDNLPKDCIKVPELEEIELHFKETLEEVIKPPFTPDFEQFKPSFILEEYFKNHFSLTAVISNYRILRISSSMYSVEKRTSTLISIAFFINLLTEQEGVLNKIPKGSMYFLEIDMNMDKLSKMLSSYYSSLYAAQSKLETKLLSRQEVMVHKFESIKANPYSIDPLTTSKNQVPIKFNVRMKNIFLSDWQNYLHQVEEELYLREHQLQENARKGYRKIEITKRSEPLRIADEVELSNYLEELKMEIDNLYTELDANEPGVTSLSEIWKEDSKEAMFNMDLYLKATPTPIKVLLSFVSACLIILIPHLYSLDWTKSDFESQWTSYLLSPLLMIIVIFIFGYFQREKIVKPIKLLINETETRKKELLNQQNKLHQKYNKYMNTIYRLFRTRQYYNVVLEEYERIKKENYLLRFHQSKINEYINQCTLLMHNLKISYQKNKQIYYDYFDAKFNPELDVINNLIYSPFEYVDELDVNEIDCLVGNQRSTFHAGHLSVINQIRFTKDQVYKL